MSGVDSDTCALSGAPMLPPTVTLNPAASSICPVNAVVVDFPFVPVIATTRPCSHLEASSSSPMIGTPRSRAFLDGRLIGRHARAQHDQVRVRQRLGAVPAELELHAQTAQRLGVGRLGAHLRQRDAGAPARQQLGGGNPAPRRAHHRHAFPFDIKLTSHHPATSHESATSHEHHRSFSVVRLNNANTIPTITNRVITFGSLQPINSK